MDDSLVPFIPMWGEGEGERGDEGGGEEGGGRGEGEDGEEGRGRTTNSIQVTNCGRKMVRKRWRKIY